MNEASVRQLLDREAIDKFVAKELAPTLALLRELVDYGVALIVKCVQSGGSLADLVVQGHFFKHAVTMLDAVEIQLSRGSVFAAGVSARSMLEAYIYLAWILHTDTERRGRQFYVWHLRQKRGWQRRVIPGTDEYERFKKHISSLSAMMGPKGFAALVLNCPGLVQQCTVEALHGQAIVAQCFLHLGVAGDDSGFVTVVPDQQACARLFREPSQCFQ